MQYDFMELNEILDVLDRINDRMLTDERIKEPLCDYEILSVNIAGEEASIGISGTPLWQTIEETREWIDDDNQEPLAECLARRLEEYISMLKQLHQACVLELESQIKEQKE